MNIEDKILIPKPPLSRDQRIEALQNEILALQKEETEECRKKVLPFLQKNVVCVWNDSGQMDLQMNGIELEKELITLIESKQNRGFYHFGCHIAPKVQVRFDDGNLTILFEVSGNVDETKKKIIEMAKELGLNISFDAAIIRQQIQIERMQKTVERLSKLKELYESKQKVLENQFNEMTI